MPTVLKQSIIENARRNDELKLKLAKANKLTVWTIDGWLRKNDMRLTTVDNLEILADHFQVLETAELLEEEKQPA